jgi:hypothetical protein
MSEPLRVRCAGLPRPPGSCLRQRQQADKLGCSLLHLITLLRLLLVWSSRQRPSSWNEHSQFEQTVRADQKPSAMLSAGVWWRRLTMHRFVSDGQIWALYCWGVRPLSILNRQAML